MKPKSRNLTLIQKEWESCTKCSLGENRIQQQKLFVFGEGTPGGILFIGEGPGKEEEYHGRPFMGPSGALLRGVLAKFNFSEYYLTNIVSCRSCEPSIDEATGLQKVYQRRGHKELGWRDVAPTTPQVEACRVRLYEEIYAVDPILIVTLGTQAGRTLSEGAFSATQDRDKPFQLRIPGVSHIPSLTEKRKIWGRKVENGVEYPIERNFVKYLVFPTLHPAYVLAKYMDKGPDSPKALFVNDIKKAIKIYERYLVEVLKVESSFVINETPNIEEFLPETNEDERAYE